LKKIRRAYRAATNASGFGAGFGVEELDRLLASQPSAHLHLRNQHGDEQQRGNDEQFVVELTSAGSAAGKTELVYLVAAAAILPAAHGDVAIGGRAGAVVVLDVDGRFDARRLYAVAGALLRHRYAANRPAAAAAGHASPPAPAREAGDLTDGDDDDDGPLSPAALRPVLVEALRHVHVFRPTTLADTIATLDALPAYLLGPPTSPSDAAAPPTAAPPPRHFSADRPPRALLLDSTGPLYWAARAAATSPAAATSTSYTSPQPQPQPPPRPPPFSALGAALRRAAAALECPALATTWPVSAPPPPRSGADGRRHADPTPPMMATTATATTTFPAQPPGAPPPPPPRLAVQRVPVRAFAPGTGVARARALGGLRAAVVERHEFRVERVDGGGGGGAAREWRFAIGEDGVRWG
jgi:hypothetical protein